MSSSNHMVFAPIRQHISSYLAWAVLLLPDTAFGFFTQELPYFLFCTVKTFCNIKRLMKSMSYGGNVEGYLLKIDGDKVRIVYCILDEGILQYFSRMGGEQLGAIALSGSKVNVFLLPPSQVSNQFRVDAQPLAPSIRRRDARQNVDAKKLVSITFAGSTSEVTHQWAVSILNWNRYSWEDGQMVCSSKNEYYNLQKLIQVSGIKINKTTRDPVVPAGVSPAVLPL